MNGRPPAQADIQRFFRLTPPSVHQMLLTLERAGLISRRAGVPRSIAILVDRPVLPQLEPGHPQPVKFAGTGTSGKAGAGSAMPEVAAPSIASIVLASTIVLTMIFLLSSASLIACGEARFDPSKPGGR